MKPAVASGTMRTPSRDVMLGSEKFHIPGGTGLWMPSYAMHNSELNWGPDTDVYRPVRHFAAPLVPELCAGLRLATSCFTTAMQRWSACSASQAASGIRARSAQERWLEPGVEYVQQSVDGSAAGNSPADAGSVKSDHRQNYELGINRDFAV